MEKSTMNKTTLCKSDDLKIGSVKRFLIDDEAIAVIRTKDGIFALKDECTHEEYPISDGFVSDNKIACPMHGALFDIKTGDALSLPAYEAIEKYPIYIKDGYVEIELDEG